METIDILKQSPLFAGVDRQTLAEIGRSLVLERYAKNRELLPGAGAAVRFYVLARGRVKVTRTNGHDGRELTLWLLGPGDGFDIVSLLDGQPPVVSAWTLDEVETLAAPMSVLHEWLERCAPFRAAVYRYIAKQLRELTELAGSLALHDTMTRLAHLLLRHFDIAKDAGMSRINLISDLSHEELASLIGSVRVVVNRLLARLKREAVVEVHNGELGIVNLKRLLRHAEAHAGSLPAGRKSRRDRSART
ncbi:MAG TPA: Crp/Fnr family transcriptional regulator [Steroidobacteraceae bacterium]|nr:Crp/Fnr family transcriptional regulator [Steroidobacteraceae bacterium]